MKEAANVGVTSTYSVTEAVAQRRSIRAFLAQSVDKDLLRDILIQAARAPSGGNLQPWKIHLVVGQRLVDLKQVMTARTLDSFQEDTVDYDVYPKSLGEPYRTRRFRAGEDMYRLLGIGAEQKAARGQRFRDNFQLFGAPAALFCFIDRNMGRPQWVDLGMYLQTVMLLLKANGLDSCPQESWSLFPKTVSGFLGVPEEEMLFCGMAIGYADPDAPVNALVTERAAPDEFIRVHA
ncbi:nitroreductase [Paraburkholderia sp. 1N]|uniref:Nitroreductase n=1 Tax=Paraburkholderia solitsugae TaxID=2675748 RepID=A0ABX2BJZ4_9BURK|nr:nitroreductase [Paraburkholderia solitsugae]NPT40256.1 nitroreductase [Paraburkholderia solitsugae]